MKCKITIDNQLINPLFKLNLQYQELKRLGLPLGFMNTSALNVNDDGTFKLKPEDLPFKSDGIISSNNSENNPNKRHNKKRGKKKVDFVLILLINILPKFVSNI